MADRNRVPFAIIGGGASGLVAAITAARLLLPQKLGPVVVLERLDRVGKKILATGNGRCNLTHVNTDIGNYHGSDVRFARGALHRMDSAATISFFSDLGMPCRTEEDGRVFPYSLQANTVLDTLRQALADLSVEIRTDFEVETVRPTEPLYIGNEPLNEAAGFDIYDKNHNHVHAQRVLITTGGCASPALGSNGSGYSILAGLGHELVSPFPAIVQVTTETTLVKPLSGIKILGRARLYMDETEIASENGEVLFTEYGLSGPPILQLARPINQRLAEGLPLHIVLDLMPDYDELLIQELLQKSVAASAGLKLGDVLNSFLHKKVAAMVVRQVIQRPLSDLARTLTKTERQLLAAMIKNLPVKITGTRDFTSAQVTAGGISTKEFRSDTLESKIIAGLYAAGEVLDIDGDCGGYNLQWAWASGSLAGRKAAEALINEKQVHLDRPQTKTLANTFTIQSANRTASKRRQGRNE